MIDEGEDSLTAAKRELLEETGYSSGKITKIGTYSDNSTKMVSELNIFLAEDAEISEEEHHLDETEEIEVLLIPFKKIFAMIENEEFIATHSIAALYLAAEKLGRIKIT